MLNVIVIPFNQITLREGNQLITLVFPAPNYHTEHSNITLQDLQSEMILSETILFSLESPSSATNT